MRKFLDSIEHHFIEGGKWKKFYPLYEAIDTIFYSPASVTFHDAQVRDGIDLKRIMITVWLCVFPAMFYGMYNLGYHANTAISNLTSTIPLSGYEFFINFLGAGGHNPNSIWDNFIYGLAYFLPIYLVTFIVGGFWEVLFAIKRGHEVNEGFFVTSILFALTLPPSTPLWMVALGISFGVVIGKEIFGGTGKNFLNPALVGRAFLYFAYPASMSGDSIWISIEGIQVGSELVDAITYATPLGILAIEGMQGLNISWLDAFWGNLPGSIGEGSTFAILIGGSILLITRIASWRIVLSTFFGLVFMSSIFNLVGSNTNPMFEIPFYWHLVLGGFAFGMIFMVTDPVSAAMTNTGKWVFGFLVGAMTVFIRVLNLSFPEGIMLAILLGNVMAPTIDYCVIRANIKRREKRTLIKA